MSRPPFLPRAILKGLLRKEMAGRVMADLDEEWADYVLPARGRLLGTMWYWGMALRSVGAVWKDVISRPGARYAGLGSTLDGREDMGTMSVPERVSDGVREVRFALRSLVRAPALSVSAISVMALGIAAAAIVFSVLDEVLIRPFSYDRPQEIVSVQGSRLSEPNGFGNVSYPNVVDVASRSRALDGLVGASFWTPAFTDPGRTQIVRGLTVSWNYFSLLGVEPAAGRFFRPEEEGEGRPSVAVIGHALWQDRFGGDPSIAGQVVSLNNVSFSIVGVAPAGFEDPVGQGDGTDIQIWRTPWFDSAEWFRSGRSWKAIGRMASGSSLEVVNQELATLMAGLAKEWPEENTGQTMRAVPVGESITGTARTTILVLMVSVGLILVIACANVANLLLARGLRRGNELAVRVALGASSGRLMRATLTEAVLLSLIGGTVGVVLAYGGLDLVAALASVSIPRLADVTIDARVLLFSFSVAVLTGLLFGTVPGLSERRFANPARIQVGGRRESRLRRALVVGEVALTVVLLFGAGLFLRTFDALYRVDVGVQTEHVASVALHDAGWADLDEASGSAQWDEILDRVAAIPQVLAVGAIDIVPLVDSYSCDGTARTDLPPPPAGEGTCTEVRVILPGALEALGIGILSGRAPERLDRDSSARVVWISEATRKLLWADGSDPLGRGLRIHSEEFTVAGVVTDVRHFGPHEPPRPMVYVTAHQEPWNGINRGLSLVVRGQGPIEGLIPQIRAQIEGAGAAIPVDQVRTMNELLDTTVNAPRFRVALSGGFALIALLISMVGLAGVLSFSVSRRKREIGVRLALGARQSEIRTMVVGEGLSLLGGGLVLGMMVALPSGLALSRFLFAVRPWDPASILAVVVLMLGGVLAASYPSAIRAARGSPASALQMD